jgi:hypothetical protein
MRMKMVGRQEGCCTYVMDNGVPTVTWVRLGLPGHDLVADER